MIVRMIPNLVFKYKSINSTEDLLRIIDIFKNRRLFFPNRTQLNDPLEGQSVDTCLGYAGSWRYSTYDEEDPYVAAELNQYRILSLSEDGFSPQLWAHYGGTYSGICLCFKTDGVFSKMKPVQYITGQKSRMCEISEFPNWEEHFLDKHVGWSYEKEWRVVEKTEQTYLDFLLDDIMCIIVGCRINEECLNILKDYFPKTVHILKASPGYRTFCVKVEPIKETYSYDGSSTDIIYTAEELLQYICNTKMR